MHQFGETDLISENEGVITQIFSLMFFWNWRVLSNLIALIY